MPIGKLFRRAVQQLEAQAQAASVDRAREIGNFSMEHMPGTLVQTGLTPNTTERMFGVDFDVDGSFDQGRDGVLGFDFDGNGIWEHSDFVRSNQMLIAYSGNNDLNGDGQIEQSETLLATQLNHRASFMDRDRDGILSNLELQMAGARMWIDNNRDGQITGNETRQISPWGTMHGIAGPPMLAPGANLFPPMGFPATGPFFPFTFFGL